MRSIFISTLLFAVVAAAEEVPLPGVSEGKTLKLQNNASMWQSYDVGFTYKDCQMPGFLSAAACARRVDYPQVGQSVRVVRPIKKMPDGNQYALVKTRGTYGWMDTSYLSEDRRRTIKNGYLYREPGVNYKMCAQEPLPEVCDGREYLSAGNVIDEFAPIQTQAGDKAFVMAEFKNDGETSAGWIESSRLELAGRVSPPVVDDVSTEATAGCTDCEEEESVLSQKAKQVFEETLKTVDEALKEKPSNSNYKTMEEFEKFACIHSNGVAYEKLGGFSQKNFCSIYASPKSNFKLQIEKAAQAFDLPEPLIACTLLVESGFHAWPPNGANAAGYAQFTPVAVRELQNQLSQNRKLKDDYTDTYHSMWKKYTRRPTTEINDSNVRMRPNVEISVGATAFFLKWLFMEQIPAVGCKGCRRNPSNPNQKEIYMAIAGYNWRPYRLVKIKEKSVSELRRSEPPPEETRGYFKKMDNCMKAGQFNSFTEVKERKRAGGKIVVVDHDKEAYEGRAAACEKGCR